MDKVVYKCNVDMLKYLGCSYEIFLTGADYTLLTFKVLFEPGRKKISNKVKDTIEDVKAYNSGSMKHSIMMVKAEDLVTLCDCKQINDISILVSDMMQFKQDIQARIISKLRHKGVMEEQIRDILNIETLNKVYIYLINNGISEDIGKDMVALFKISHEEEVIETKKPHR